MDFSTSICKEIRRVFTLTAVWVNKKLNQSLIFFFCICLVSFFWPVNPLFSSFQSLTHLDSRPSSPESLKQSLIFGFTREPFIVSSTFINEIIFFASSEFHKFYKLLLFLIWKINKIFRLGQARSLRTEGWKRLTQKDFLYRENQLISNFFFN